MVKQMYIDIKSATSENYIPDNEFDPIHLDINHIYQPLRSGRMWHKVNL